MVAGALSFLSLAFVVGIFSLSNFVSGLHIYLPDGLSLYRWHILKYERLNIDGALEPEMPGYFENNKTLLGVDANNNQVRDDVEIWINHHFKERNQRLAAKQWVTDKHYIFSNINDKHKINDFYDSGRHGEACFYFVVTDFELDSYDQLTHESYWKILKLYYNNSERSKASDTVSDYLNGAAISSHGGPRAFLECNFVLDNIDKYLENDIKKTTRGNYEEYKNSRHHSDTFKLFMEYKAKHSGK